MRMPRYISRSVHEVASRLNSLQSFIKTRFYENPGLFWQRILYCCFWISLALFPIGYGWREITPPLCLIFLLCYYRYAWHESVLKRLTVRWLFYSALAMILIGVLFSAHPAASLLHAGMGINKAYILPFIAMECVRTPKQLKGLVWAFVFACFWEGLDGIWQLTTGRDFIMGYEPNSGRLTGSLGDYTIGNYLALALIPSFGIWFILRRKFLAGICLLLFTSLFWPAFTLFLGASSRSGVLAIGGSVFIWLWLTKGFKNWRVWVYPTLIFILFHILKPDRLNPASILNDNRWDLWQLGWRVFLEHPLFGAGAGQYNTVFREMGLSPAREVITISHPHNLYLDMLYAHGIIGFCLGSVFILGFAWWGWRQIRKPLSLELSARTNVIYWRLTAWMWLGYIGWLLNGVFGHDFYRIWWLAEAMTTLGIMIGAIVNGKCLNRSQSEISVNLKMVSNSKSV